MKTLTIGSIVVLLFLVSCGPITPHPTVTSTSSSRPPQAIPTIVSPLIEWPGLHDGWTAYKNTASYLSTPVYDPAGYLWTLSGSRVYRWSIETGRFIEFTTEDGLPEKLGSMTFFDGKVWVSSTHGEVAFYSEGKWVTQSVTDGETSALSSTGDRLWLAGKEGMYFFDRQEWKSLELFPEELRDSNYRVAKSKDGSLWFWYFSHILRFNGNSWQEYPNLRDVQSVFTLSDGTLLFKYDNSIVSFDGQALNPLILPGSQYRYSIRSALLTPAGDLWLQVYDYHADATGERFPTYLIHNGRAAKIPNVKFENAPDPAIYSPASIIPQGWVFTVLDGVYLYDEKDWRKFSVEGSALERIVNSTVIGFAPDGALWTMQSNLPVRFDGREAKSVFEGYNPCYSTYKFQMDPNGSIWGGGYMTNNLCYYDVEAKTISRFDLFFDVSDFDIASDGSIWVSSKSGFIANLTLDALRSGDYRRIELIKIGGDTVQYALNPERIEVSPDGAVWIFARGAGLYRYDGADWEYFGMSNLKDSTAFAVDSKGRAWVGLCGKLMMRDGEKWNTYPQNCINPTKMIVAPDDAVWFINCDGVYRFDGAEWTRFTKEQLGGFIPERILVAPDGALWFISYQKWTRYKP